MNLYSLHCSRAIALALLLITNADLAFAQASSRPANRQVARRPAAAKSRQIILERNIRAELNFLASDAMQGRGSATGYERIAAEYIGSQFRQFGLEPAGDPDASGAPGFVQRVPLEGLKSAELGATWNAAGLIRGSDPGSAAEAIFLSAHLDHLGVGQPVGGDAIYNGADDDASGCVSVMELARVLAAGPRPKRTIYFVCFGSEERGGWGAQYFVAHSPVPLDHVVADLNLEMLGRPDARVPVNTLWLTGYDRSNLGPELARRGARLVADPHPEQNFFQRSDNYTLALRGVIAHTVSSFGLHTDYHRPGDEATRIDFVFMTQSINSLIEPVRWLANSTFRPAWEPGKAPHR